MSLKTCELRGITWDHSRAFPPLVATAQRFEELNPGVRVSWEKRSLHAFGHANVAELAQAFDLVIIDHPWCGFSVDRQVFIDLFSFVETATVEDLRRNSVGESFASYVYHGQLIALPVDAATPVASYRPDLLLRDEIPQTWADLLTLAKGGRVASSGFHVDLLLHLIMLVVTIDSDAFTSPESWARRETVLRAMEMLQELVALMPKAFYKWNPIAVYEQMTKTDEIVYCPFAYSYSNYARPGFARRTLGFTDIVAIEQAARLRSVLGGTGIALSKGCQSVEQAIAYMAFTASSDVQRGIYTEAGGQPAHRAAWTDARANNMASGFFTSTLAATDRAYVRPRYHGFLYFQENAGRTLVAWLHGECNSAQTADAMDDIYRTSRQQGKAGSSQQN